MSLFHSWFGALARARPLDKPMNAAIARWKAASPPDLRELLDTQRWLVVDVETTGLNTRRDRLLAIGAVLMEGSSICIGQSFEVVIKQTAPSHTDNILIHRIPGNEQMEGVDAATAMAEFLDFSKKLPCVAFHAAFDEAMLKRAFDESFGIDFSPLFIDLALLAPALVHDAPGALSSLDDWLEYFSIVISARHRAIADAVGTAQLFQMLLRRAAAQGFRTTEVLFELARDQRWLSRMSRN